MAIATKQNQAIDLGKVVSEFVSFELKIVVCMIVTFVRAIGTDNRSRAKDKFECCIRFLKRFEKPFLLLAPRIVFSGPSFILLGLRKSLPSNSQT